jgi:hypothetical protein
MKKFLAVLLSLSFLLPLPAFAADQGDLLQKIEALSKELDRLKQQMQEMQQKETAKEERITVVEKKAEQAAGPSWLEIGGDYRFRVDSLKGKVQDHYHFGTFQQASQNVWTTNSYQVGAPLADGVLSVGEGTYNLAAMQALAASGQTRGYDAKNDAVFLNRFGLNLVAKATEDIAVKARLLMYKAWGNDFASRSPFFADKFVLMDGNLGHIPQDNTIRVDYAYATWSNIGGAPVWFSVGRRPSTGGIPTNIRQNIEKPGTAGVPGLLVDYAFDGGTIGYAPDIDALPGAYAKICYGRGIDTNFRPDNNRFKDTQFVGLNLVPYDTDNLHVELQYQKGMDIFAYPGGSDPFGLGAQNTNIGDIDWWGGVITGKINNAGPGDLTLFATAAQSRTHPNDNMYRGNFFMMNPATGALTIMQNAALAGLLYDPDALGGSTNKKSRSGSAIYLGARYDIKSSGTKIGVEYNHGSKYWMAFTPASDDLWTSKLGTRGDVYEAYLIQELKLKPIAKRGKAFFRLGYQHYKFNYTGSGFWLGEPQKISDLTVNSNQLLRPVKNANDIYLTFDVIF